MLCASSVLGNAHGAPIRLKKTASDHARDSGNTQFVFADLKTAIERGTFDSEQQFCSPVASKSASLRGIFDDYMRRMRIVTSKSAHTVCGAVGLP